MCVSWDSIEYSAEAWGGGGGGGGKIFFKNSNNYTLKLVLKLWEDALIPREENINLSCLLSFEDAHVQESKPTFQSSSVMYLYRSAVYDSNQRPDPESFYWD